MGTEAELALAGRRGLPDRLVEQGFKFMYTNLEAALADLFYKPAAEVFETVKRSAATPEGRPVAALEGREVIAGGRSGSCV